MKLKQVMIYSMEYICCICGEDSNGGYLDREKHLEYCKPCAEKNLTQEELYDMPIIE